MQRHVTTRTTELLTALGAVECQQVATFRSRSIVRSSAWPTNSVRRSVSPASMPDRRWVTSGRCSPGTVDGDSRPSDRG